MRVVICDDEPEYRRLLHERILQYSFAQDFEANIAEYESGERLIAALDAGERADVYFLDIQMESGADDGIRAAREIRRRGDNGLIIYVTGFIDYAQTGYEVKAFRYLLKSQISGAGQPNDKLAEVLSAVRKELAGEEYYAFQVNREVLRVEKRKILYLESNKRQLYLYTEEESFCFYGSLDQAQEQLGDGFLRCHRSYLVNISQIQRYSREQISLKGGAAVPVSRSYARECMRRLMLEMA